MVLFNGNCDKGLLENQAVESETVFGATGLRDNWSVGEVEDNISLSPSYTIYGNPIIQVLKIFFI